MKKGTERKVLILIIAIFIVSRLIIFSIGYLSSFIITKDTFASTNPSILDLFCKWDSGWYLSIEKNGYDYTPGKESSVNFFPLYPLLINLFAFIFGNPKLMGCLISNISLLLASIYLYKLARLDFDESVSMSSVLLMLIFPTSFFFSIIYTEGLFLFLSISAFYYARKRNWKIVGVLGFFASLTKFIGVFIFIPLLFEYLELNFSSFKLKKEKIKKDMLYLLLIPAGLLSFMVYLYLFRICKDTGTVRIQQHLPELF